MVLSPPSTLHYNSSTLLDHVLDCPCDHSMEHFYVHSFPVSTMEVIASLIFIKFSLCAKSDTLFISTSLPLYHSLIRRRFSFPLKIPPSLFFIYLFVIITVIITIAYYYYYFYYQYRSYFYHHCY